MNKIRKGDQVIVLAGRDKGKRGTVVLRKDDEHLVVEGINLVKKHTKPNPLKGTTGGIVEKAMPIHQSNVAIYNPATGKADRVGIQVDGDSRKRVFTPPSTLMPTRDGLPLASTSATFEIWMGMTLSTTPPVVPSIGFGRTCFLATFTPSTVTWSPSTASTVPCLPLSLPVRTMMRSPLRILFMRPPITALPARATRSS
jgi:large subunit ribosomal protein L24